MLKPFMRSLILFGVCSLTMPGPVAASPLTGSESIHRSTGVRGGTDALGHEPAGDPAGPGVSARFEPEDGPLHDLSTNQEPLNEEYVHQVIDSMLGEASGANNLQEFHRMANSGNRATGTGGGTALSAVLSSRPDDRPLVIRWIDSLLDAAGMTKRCEDPSNRGKFRRVPWTYDCDERVATK